ncbi:MULTISPECIES: helix-turn-helix domain-containing protein [Methylomonas]|uniref:XRE family transcriptional regulator n=1 Tax=Methylomonas koyamae TaxID=702114 RepID=A0A177NTC2_9GAMM|nr:helix-turn-helix transcriptional regulator [Methylomonas koyamae]OAI20533.1 XRE family transcriptional regulator [Methylomonas koyamae]
MSDSNPRRLLGAFIRSHREHLPTPAKSIGRRRTPGWRREELADAAGVSVTWLTWLEQGREVQASVTTLNRLAQALSLSPAERASLFDLAGRHDPDTTAEVPMDWLPQLLTLPDHFNGPAYLIDRVWTARAWNRQAAELFVDWLGVDSSERNLLNYVFLNAKAQQFIVDWPDRARRLAAEFRADYHRRPLDGELQRLVDQLLTRSPAFAHYWQQQTVLHREGGERRFSHSLRGLLSYRQTTLVVAMQPDCKLVCLVPNV